jgi:hypothetical protein
MAILQDPVPLTLSLQTEIASRNMHLTRDITDDGLGQVGSVQTVLGTAMFPKITTYEVDSQGNKLAIYETQDLDAVTISQDSMMQLYAIRATLADGTVAYLGDIISNVADQLLQQIVPQATGTINTPAINLEAIFAAQAAQDAAASLTTGTSDGTLTPPSADGTDSGMVTPPTDPQ